tara:strand:+ start:3600 stop:4193 length:594 start_codon:yes stop_codon:yes gene_type:complete
MARTIYQIAPIESGEQQGVGILLPMNKSAHANNSQLNTLSGQSSLVGSDYKVSNASGGSVFALSFTTEQQAISNLKNLLATSRGERLMQPLFGTRIREAVFQPNTLNLEEFIRETITESINKWLPYINLGDVDIIRNIDQYSFAIRVNFSVTENGANRVIIILANENNINVASETTELPETLQAIGTFGDTFAAGSY